MSIGILDGYPACAVVFSYMVHESIEIFTSTVMSYIEILQQLNVAHNIYIAPRTTIFNGIQLFVFPRKNILTVDEKEINVAVLEFSGQFIIKSDNQMEEVTQKYLSERLENASISDSDFMKIFNRFIELPMINKIYV